ncbi:FAD-dependent monooxygenase [Frankia sp. AgB32]|uniref:FAD-dependent monooxygenase n=1 Tax=Frankia sp. AgB32 TaxID=631119 RepID=UPI00200DD7A5|nr:FAD-dependent monooxygenase [Frankia sp. AgB32]MCK9894945.1 FAD-dependent monooxygenase [Frankia sp. AgB32]
MDAPALPTETDVLVVRAGPTGLAAGLALSTLGVDHVVVDTAAGVQEGSRAAGVQPRGRWRTWPGSAWRTS